MKVLLVLAVLAVLAFLKVWFLQPLIYRVLVSAYGLYIRLGSLVNAKARLWVSGRRGQFERMKAHQPPAGKKVIWFHCSSLGEFEQARPVIEETRAAYPNAYIVLTFFSPSGYTVRKDYEMVDAVWYLPLDTPAHAKDFITLIKPDFVVFVKYEFWYFYLKTLSEHKIPVILISAVFRKKQLFFKWYGRLHKSMLRYFTHIFVQHQDSLNLLHKYGFKHAEVAYDTRFDRVAAIAKEPFDEEVFDVFTGDYNVLIAGSTWPDDEKILARTMYKNLVHVNFKLILAPHHIDARSMKKTLKLFKDFSIKYSDIPTLSKEVIQAKRILILDNMGMLSKVYRYGDVNYVGGGLTKGVHNTLEAAVYGKPVIFGPKYKKFLEASDLVKANAALIITSADDLLNRINLMNQFPFVWKGVGDDAAHYVHSHTGGSATIVSYIRSQF